MSACFTVFLTSSLFSSSSFVFLFAHSFEIAKLRHERQAFVERVVYVPPTEEEREHKEAGGKKVEGGGGGEQKKKAKASEE